MTPTGDHLAEFLYQLLEQDAAQGLEAWSTFFDQLFAARQLADCRWLLREIKRLAPGELAPAVLVLVRAAGGMLDAQLGHRDLAVACYDQALQAAPDQESVAWLHSNLGNINYLARRLDAARESYQVALTIYQELGHERGAALVLSNLGSVHRDMGDLEEARACYEQALSTQQKQGQDDLIPVTLTNLGSVLQSQGDWSAAEEAYRAAHSSFVELADLARQAQVLGNLGTLYLDTGCLEEAMDCFLQDLDLAQQLGDHVSQAQTLNNLAIVFRRLGCLDEAFQCYEHSLALKRELGDRRGELITLINLVHLDQARRDRPMALRHLAESRVLAQALGDEERLAQIRQLEANYHE